MKTAKTKPPKSVSRFTLHESASGSALILAVVLTSLLAIIGVMFVMMARVDRMATSAISENKELNFAVETVVANISQELALDVPGMPKGSEYYDYPDTNNAWLASLEPYKSGSNYYWRQISDVYNRFSPVELGLKATIISDNQKPSDVGDSNRISRYPADADGDGVADSNWVIISDMTSSKGKPIYAAIRVVDNGGMLNVNTAYKFDPNAAGVTAADIDGSSQLQINLAALSQRGANGSLATAADKLQAWRCGTESNNLSLYEQNVVWRYGNPSGAYTPFDISDELELRYRFLVNHEDIRTRLERLWTWSFNSPTELNTPIRTGGASNIDDWFYKAQHDVMGPNDVYSYRHIATNYNMDRIIDPNGHKMININRADANDANSIYGAIKSALETNFVDVNVAAQIAVNLVDFRDSDSNVSTIDVNSVRYYGFEQPCIYISELAHRFIEPNVSPLPVDNFIDRSYAVELYKPYSEDDYPEPNQWQLNISGYTGPPILVTWSGTKHFHVIYFEDSCAPLNVKFDANDADSNLPGLSQTQTFGPGNVVFKGGDNISLQRQVGSNWITVDSVTVPDTNAASGWLVSDINGVAHSIQRDITLHKCIRRLWDSNTRDPNLGHGNSYVDPNLRLIQAHPANKNFTNIGEIGMVFRKGAYYKDAADRPDRIGYGTNKTEEDVRLNLADPNFQQLFKYLTVFDPYNFHPADPNYANEKRIKGRININTAPWFVLAQLPWMRYEDSTSFGRAKAVSDYRDNTLHGFKNIGELMLVGEMRNLGSDGKDNLNTGTPKGTRPYR